MNTHDIERARHLIPGLLKKTLDVDDSVWMAQFLKNLRSNGGPVLAEFEQEMAWVERTQQHLAETSPVFDAQIGWQRMQGRLNTVTNTAVKNTVVTQNELSTQSFSVMPWLKSLFRDPVENAMRWWQKPAVAAFATAMLMAQMGLLVVLVRNSYNVETQATIVTPASGEKGLSDSITLMVVFKEQTTLKQVQQLLGSVQAQVTGGPGAIGIWEIAIPKDKMNDAMKVLGASVIVESASPQ